MKYNTRASRSSWVLSHWSTRSRFWSERCMECWFMVSMVALLTEISEFKALISSLWGLNWDLSESISFWIPLVLPKIILIVVFDVKWIKPKCQWWAAAADTCKKLNSSAKKPMRLSLAESRADRDLSNSSVASSSSRVFWSRSDWWFRCHVSSSLFSLL